MRGDNWLTVVTVVRNDAAGLLRTSDSVAGQMVPGVQHLIVDGDSDDDTPDVLAALATRPATRVISEADRGIYDAMNKGWRHADGRYVQYLNAGDVYSSPHELPWIRDRVVDDSPSWLRTQVRFVDTAGVQTRPVAATAIDDRFWWGWQATLHQGAFMTRDLLQELGGFDIGMRVQGDFDLMLRAWRAGCRPRLVDRVTVDVDASGVSTQLWRVGYREMHVARTRGASVPRTLASRLDLGAHVATVGAKRTARRGLEAVLGEDRVKRLRR